MPTANRVMVPYRPQVPVPLNRSPLPIPMRFGALGGNTDTAASGAASGAATGATLGSVVPGVGTAIGAVVGGVVGAIAGIFGGTSNPQIQIDKTNAINLFTQYTAVMGTVSGRSIGLENMNFIFRGACFMGHFPDWNNETELPDSLMSMPGSPYGQNDNCFAVLWASAQKGTPAPGGSGANTGNGGVPVTDAKTFVDNYVWPANSPDVDTDPWATNTDSVGKQVIYDCADAYIASVSSGTTPYIANPPKQAATSTPATTTVSAPVVTATCKSTVAAPSYSPSGTTLLYSGSGSIVTPQGTWTLSNGAFYNNGAQVTGAPTPGGMAGVGIQYLNGVIYVYNNNGSVSSWGPSGWTELTQAASPPWPSSFLAALTGVYWYQPPTVPTVVDSTDGSQVTAPGTAMEASDGALIYFGSMDPNDPNASYGYPVFINSVYSGNGVGLLMLNGGKIYSVNSEGSWYQYSGQGSGEGVWTALSGAPTVQSSTPTTSTVSSPQSGVSSTPGSASCAVAGTNAAGESVTTADIQAIINQYATSGATQSQVLAEVIGTLEEDGVAVSSGLQSEIASMVAASIPAASTSSTSSDLGWYLVGGGVALLALLFFMNRKKAAT